MEKKMEEVIRANAYIEIFAMFVFLTFAVTFLVILICAPTDANKMSLGWKIFLSLLDGIIFSLSALSGINATVKLNKIPLVIKE